MRFESYFDTISVVPGLPTIAGKRPKKPKPVATPVAYEVAAPADLEKPFWIGIRYQGKALIYDWRNFQVSFGSDTTDGSLTDFIHTSGSNYPMSLSLLGARFTVLGLEDKKLKVRVDETMPPQPFGIMRTVTYR
jgi:hypothetical protein